MRQVGAGNFGFDDNPTTAEGYGQMRYEMAFDGQNNIQILESFYECNCKQGSTADGGCMGSYGVVHKAATTRMLRSLE